MPAYRTVPTPQHTQSKTCPPLAPSQNDLRPQCEAEPHQRGRASAAIGMAIAARRETGEAASASTAQPRNVQPKAGPPAPSEAGVAEPESPAGRRADSFRSGSVRPTSMLPAAGPACNKQHPLMRSFSGFVMHGPARPIILPVHVLGSSASSGSSSQRVPRAPLDPAGIKDHSPGCSSAGRCGPRTRRVARRGTVSPRHRVSPHDLTRGA